MSLMLHRLGLLRPSVGDPVLTVPDAFDADDWDIGRADGKADITIHALPANGGAAITDIEYRLDAGSWVSSGGTVSFSITGLTNGQEYGIELRAINSIGASDASDAKQVTPATVPSAFEAGAWSITAGDEQADITISDLPDDGGDTITDVEYRLDGGSWASANGTSSFTIGGLTNDTEYDVELRAVNDIGAGTASDVKSVTPEDAGGEWTPALVSAAVWIDPSDLGTMFQERTGATATTPAVIDGAVGTMANKGALGGYFIADGDANRPILRNSGDVFWLEFDGAGDGLRLTLGASQTPATVTSVCAWQIAGGSWGRCVSLSGSSGGDTGPASMCVSRNNTNLELRIESASVAAAARAFTLDADFVHTAQVSGTYRYARMDLGTPATATAGSTSFNFSLVSYGRGHYGGDFINGRFYGAILVLDTLEDADEGAAISYFAARQGRSL